MAAVLALVVSGCVSGGTGADDPFDPLWSEAALQSGAGHDHEDRDQHRGLSTPNFQGTGFEPLVSDHYGKPAGSYFCGDAQTMPDGRRIAAVESRSDVGFAFLDVTDAAAPTWLGELVMPLTHIYDLAVVPDGKHVVLVASKMREENLPVDLPPLPHDGVHGLSGAASPVEGTASPANAAAAPPPMWRDACGERPVQDGTDSTEDPLPRPGHIILVDITTEGGPTIVDSQPMPGFGHSVFTTAIAGTAWALVSTTYFYTDTTAGAGVDQLSAGYSRVVTTYALYEVADSPAGGKVLLRGTYKPLPEAEETSDVGPDMLGPRAHDGWLSVHPGTGRTLGYLAGGDRFSIVDWTDPAQPQLLSEWTDAVPGREGYSGNLHSAYAMPEMWGDRHYTVLGPEFGGHPTEHPSGILWVLDTTDPAAPREVAAWTLPHEVEWNGTYMFSNHYFSVHDRTLFVSMYHGGVWAIDLAPVGSDDFVLLDSVGVFMPDRDPPEEPARRLRWAPTVEEVIAFPDGTLVTFDGNSGAYTFRFDPDRPAPPPKPWPIDPVAATPDGMVG